jgi:hypothetical protein
MLPTETPFPALQLIEAQQRAEDLLNTNLGCSLPCWWGIIPGITPWSAAQSFLYQFDQEIYSRTAGRSQPFAAEVIIPVRSEIFSLGFLSHWYTVEENTVQLIEVQYGTSPLYSLSKVLAKYGQPTEVWARTYADTPSTTHANFLIVAFYAKLGIMAAYDENATKGDQIISACLPSSLTASNLVLWAASDSDDFQSVINQTSLTDKDLHYRSLEEATRVSVGTFFDTLSRPDAQLCIETPIDLWGG